VAWLEAGLEADTGPPWEPRLAQVANGMGPRSARCAGPTGSGCTSASTATAPGLLARKAGATTSGRLQRARGRLGRRVLFAPAALRAYIAEHSETGQDAAMPPEAVS
jgi:hypothetical protein